MSDKNFNISKMKKSEEKDYCFRCGAYEFLFEDPNIEGLFFCKNCWLERVKTEDLEKMGYDEEIPYDE